MTKILVKAIIGDSIVGSNSVPSYAFKYMGATSPPGDSSKIERQRAATYRNAGGNILMCNMAMAGSDLTVDGGANAPSAANLLTFASGIYSPDLIVARKSIPGCTPRKYMLFYAQGRNGLCLSGYADRATYMAALVAYLAARRAAGFDLIAIGDVLPSTGFSGASETRRLACNADFANSAWRLANGVDYYAALATATGASDATNVTYYSDGTHPTAALHTNLNTGIYAPMMTQIVSDIG